MGTLRRLTPDNTSTFLMNPLQSPTTPSPVAALKPETIYSLGTLRYNKRQLIVLFVWLMWNDFGITLLESIGQLSGVMMRDFGATYTQMAMLGTIGGLVGPWINPWVSTWSDRHRGPYGRRRPFLLVATPIFAVLLMAVPFMPDLYYFLERYPVMVRLFAHLPMNGPALFIGVCGLVSGLFNGVVLAIFSYLYWDVVPENVLGRFNSLKANVALVAGLVWSFFIYGQGQHHMKAVYVGTGLFSLTVYMLSVWKIKEGEYPPPDEHKKGGILAPFRAYFVECFSESFFLWVFFAHFIYQAGNGGQWYQFNYLHYDLGLDLSSLGWVDGWGKLCSVGFGVLLGFYVGAVTDRLKGVRLMAPCLFSLAALIFASYFYVHDKWTYLLAVCLKNLVHFVMGIAFGAFTVEVFPREKLGQFCSAQAVFHQFLNNLTGPFVAMLFDWLKNNRLGFLWQAGFYFLAALAYLKVYSNWKKRHGHVAAPHAG